jgi:putative flippase GtrA
MAQSKTSSLIVKFVIVGIATLILDTTVTTLLYKHGHLPAGVASAIGFTSGFLVNFIGNRGVVFKSVEGYHFKRKSQILMYVVLVFFNLAFTSLMTEVLVSRAGGNIIIVKICLGVLVATWNFLIYRTIIFKPPKSSNSLDLEGT